MQIHLSTWQRKVWDDIHRFKVIAAGRRVGKTTFSALKMIYYAVHNTGSIVWYVSPSYRQSEQIMWRMVLKYLPRFAIEKTNDTKLRIELKNGSILELKGADTDPDALRGVRIDFIVCDEVASFRNWRTVWNEVLRPTLIDSKGSAIFIGTPKGFNHFYELYTQKDEDYIIFKFTSYDNPYISKEEIDKAKKELTEDTFQQEFMAEFRAYTGLVHKLWEREIHLIEPFIVPNDWIRNRGIDYGSAHPTGSIRLALDKEDNWFLERSYKQHKRTIEDHAKVILAQDYGLPIIGTFGDPSGAQWEMEFAQYGLVITQANKEKSQNARSWVEFCVEKINERMKPIIGHVVYLPDGRKIENAPRFFVFDTQENKSFVNEVEYQKWRETASGEILPVIDESDDPNGGHYDLLAGLRYFAVSYNKPEPLYIPPKNDISNRNWKIG